MSSTVSGFRGISENYPPGGPYLPTVVLVPTLHPSCALQARNQSFETRCKLRQNGGANQGFHPHALRIHASARIHCALMHVYRITDSCSARSCMNLQYYFYHCRITVQLYSYSTARTMAMYGLLPYSTSTGTTAV